MQLPNGVAKARSRALTELVDGFTDCYSHLVGTVQKVSIVEVAADGRHLVGHNKSYVQVETFLSAGHHWFPCPKSHSEVSPQSLREGP